MKKTLAAMAVLGAFAGSAFAADVTVYGVVDLGLNYQHQKVGDADATDKLTQYSGQNSGSRFGLSDITITSSAVAGNFELYSGEEFASFYIETTWNYKPSPKIDVDSFQKTGYFTVINNNGRYEIAQFFDHYD